MSKTERLYYEDVTRKEFDGKVLSCDQEDSSWKIVLDRTVFYPEGGGQPSDEGVLVPAEGEEVAVLDVQERGEEVVHVTSAPIAPGTTVHGRIDWDRRYDLMQQHSGEHIVSGTIHRNYGYENVGFHMGEDFITIDLSGILTMDQCRQIEDEVNDYIIRCIPMEVLKPQREELKNYDYRSKKELEGDVRLVHFPGGDLCACCGLHVRNTGEIGLVKILSCKHFREGVRIEMLSGKRALRYLDIQLNQNRQIGVALSVRPDETAEAVARLQKEIYELKGALAEEKGKRMDELAASCQGLSHVVVFGEDMSPVDVRKCTDRILDEITGICAVLSGDDEEGYKYALGVREGDIRSLVKEMNGQLQGRGGGKPFFAQGVLKAGRNQAEEFFKNQGFQVKKA